SKSSIDDAAHLFSADMKKEATAFLQKIEQDSGIPVVIDTIASTDGEPINTLALSRARDQNSHGLYLLIAQKQREVSRPLVHKDHADRFSEQTRSEIRQAVISHFEKGEFDGGLLASVQQIGQALDVSPEFRNVGTSSALVQRGGINLTLEGAQLAIKGTQQKAEELGLKLNIAVVDDGGHLIAFARMNGARPASGYTAMTKATTAATFRQPTGPIKRGDSPPDPLLNLSLQNAAAASGGKITTLYGGVPIEVDGQIIGAVGCGGGTGEQDAECARAGIATLMDALTHHPAKE
ncbi:MAG TPA: heme-binding protein, partial [Isosphaeraceae bacterium]|nr:heme-binding protein [Isosphaeraceae bacterium]